MQTKFNSIAFLIGVLGMLYFVTVIHYCFVTQPTVHAVIMKGN